MQMSSGEVVVEPTNDKSGPPGPCPALLLQLQLFFASCFLTLRLYHYFHPKFVSRLEFPQHNNLFHPLDTGEGIATISAETL